MSTEYTEDPAQGFFNYWSGRYPKSAVRMIDLYLTWRENEEFPPLADFENLTSLSTPVSLLDKPLLAQIARSSVTSLTLTMGTGAALPRGLFRLARLESLSLLGQDLARLPDWFEGLPRLTRLDLSQNSLDELPPSLLSSTSLRDLDVSLNCLARVPAFPPGSPLAKLDLRSNRLASLETERLPRDLVELKIFGPELTELPASIVDLARLHTLEFGYSVRALPDLSRLEQLVSIALTGQLDETLFDRLPATLESISYNSVKDAGMERVPPSIGRFTRLRKLDLTCEPVTTIAAELRDLPLETFHLPSTRLADTPSYENLPGSLQHLSLANVGMTRFPPRALELERLRHLSLGSNRLDALPDDLGRLAELEILELDRNQIPALPESIGRLTALRELSARSNRIASLPASMMGLSALEKLELAGNPLREIPDELRSQIEQKRRW